ncbi:MAG TPA: ABC transporter permease [Candidatus Binataceae bacterium]|nr:ABC transporter permease [Candidatus Binataceae bacterium]
MRFELRIALRYLRARRKDAFISVTTLLSAVGVMIGVAALIVTLSVMGGFEVSLKQRVLALSFQVEVVSIEGSIPKYDDLQQKIVAVPHVAGSDPFILGQAMLSSGRGLGGVVVRGIEPDNPVIASQWSRYMVEGSLADLQKAYNPPTPNDQPPQGAIAIGVTLAQKLKVKRGDPIRVIAPILGAGGNLTARSSNFVVGAIFDSGMTFLDTNIVFMDLMRAQNFFGRPGVVDGIDVHLTTLDATDQVANTLRGILPSQFRVRTWVQYNQSASAGFAMLKRVYSMVLMLLIGVAAFNLIATLIMVVMEKRKDVAVLMAMGATPSEIRRIFVWKGLIVGAAGTIAGLMIGAIGCVVLQRYHFIHISREIYGISSVPIAVDPMSFVWVALASMVLCLLATIYPARQASHELPVEVFRT